MSRSVHRLLLASVNLSGQFNPPSYEDTRIEVYAYLIIIESQVLLVDTGVGEGNDYIDRRFEPRRTPIAEELMRFGLQPSDVDLLVNSHLHFDHCGNNQQFPQAQVFIQSSELKIARTPRYTVPDWFDHERAQITSVDGDRIIAPGVTLLSTPGHTPGHQSVLIETREGNVLIVAQAAYTADEFHRGGDPAEQAHQGFEEHYRQSISRLKSFNPQALYFSHDSTAAIRQPDDIDRFEQ